MLISSTHRFIFIHIPKTAGTSVTKALAPNCLNTPFSAGSALMRGLPVQQSPETAWFQMHDTASFVRKKLSPPVFDSFLRFAVVRNPFDHAISHFEFIKTYRYKRLAQKVQAMSFRDYLNWRLAAPQSRWMSRTGLFARLPDQSHYVTATDGTLLVNRVLKFDTLNRDLNTLTADLGINTPTLGHARKSKRQGRGQPLAALYEPDTIDLVTRLYDRDFALFDYARTPPEGDV